MVVVSACLGSRLRLRVGCAFFHREEPARNFHASALVVHGRLENAGADAYREVENWERGRPARKGALSAPLDT